MATQLRRIQGAARENRAVSVSAFTIIELVLVLAIVAVVAGIAVPRYAAASGRYRTHAAAIRVMNDLVAARDKAVARSGASTVSFTHRDSAYKIADPGGTTLVSLTVAPYYAVVLTPSFGGLGAVSFNAWGVPSAGGTLGVYGSGVRYNVSVDAGTGRVSLSGPTIVKEAEPVFDPPKGEEIVVIPK